MTVELVGSTAAVEATVLSSAVSAISALKLSEPDGTNVLPNSKKSHSRPGAWICSSPHTDRHLSFCRSSARLAHT